MKLKKNEKRKHNHRSVGEQRESKNDVMIHTVAKERSLLSTIAQ